MYIFVHFYIVFFVHSYLIINTIQDVLDNWYVTTKKLNTYENNIETNAEWCNDLSIAKEKNEFGNSYTYYGTYSRLDTYYEDTLLGPSLKCPSTTDSENIYNGKIALLSADEVIFAGGFNLTLQPIPLGLSSSYLSSQATEDEYWTLSPSNCNDYYCEMFTVNSPSLYETSLDSRSDSYMEPYTFLVRPALVLNSDVKIEEGGKGTLESPYVIENS